MFRTSAAPVATANDGEVLDPEPVALVFEDVIQVDELDDGPGNILLVFDDVIAQVEVSAPVMLFEVMRDAVAVAVFIAAVDEDIVGPFEVAAVVLPDGMQTLPAAA